MNKTYLLKKVHMLAVVLVIIGAVNWGLVGTIKVDLVAKLLGKGILARAVYILVGISALYIAFNRDTYLPFLGNSLMPCSVLSDRIPPGATREVTVDVTPGAKVLYWASEPSTEHLKEINNWEKAYTDYQNAGVATADSNGKALLKVRDPQPYKVPMKGRLESHVHFRVCGQGGFMDRVKTVFIGDGHVEGFQSYY
jgi:hypothetical protein